MEPERLEPELDADEGKSSSQFSQSSYVSEIESLSSCSPLLPTTDEGKVTSMSVGLFHFFKHTPP